MTWQRTYRATDIRTILANLLGYFTTNQTDILHVASPSKTLDNLTVYRTAEVRTKTDFPHMGCVKRRTQTDRGDDGLHITYSLTFEIEVATTHTKEGRTAALEVLQVDSDNYAYGFELAVLNIPNATLFTGITGTYGAEIMVTSSDPLEVAISDTKSLFNTQVDVVLTFRELAY